MKNIVNNKDVGLLILRIGIGIMFIMHGYPKIMGGPQVWNGLGQAMGVLGITFAPGFWGFMAAFSELVGGIMLLLGVFVRPFSLLLAITMVVAAGMHLAKGDGLMGASHAIELGIVFISLIFIGPGKFNLAELAKKIKK